MAIAHPAWMSGLRVAARSDSQSRCGGLRASNRSYKGFRQPKSLERPTIQGDSPVGDVGGPPLRLTFQSSTVTVELRVKLVGPPSKAKYSITTDSVQVGRLNDEKHPY